MGLMTAEQYHVLYKTHRHRNICPGIDIWEKPLPNPNPTQKWTYLPPKTGYKTPHPIIYPAAKATKTPPGEETHTETLTGNLKGTLAEADAETRASKTTKRNKEKTATDLKEEKEQLIDRTNIEPKVIDTKSTIIHDTTHRRIQ